MAATQQYQNEVSRLATLRAIAQQHLAEIGQQEEREKHEEQQVRSVLAEEAKRRSTKGSDSVWTRDPSAGIAGERQIEKGTKMRSAQDVLDRLRWDDGFDSSEYVVGYLDRFGGIMEIRVSEWLKDSTAEDWIPQHRIRYFKRSVPASSEEEIVWHRLQRIDRVFGTGGGSG